MFGSLGLSNRQENFLHSLCDVVSALPIPELHSCISLLLHYSPSGSLFFLLFFPTRRRSKLFFTTWSLSAKPSEALLWHGSFYCGSKHGRPIGATSAMLLSFNVSDTLLKQSKHSGTNFVLYSRWAMRYRTDITVKCGKYAWKVHQAAICQSQHLDWLCHKNACVSLNPKVGIHPQSDHTQSSQTIKNLSSRTRTLASCSD